ncbi:hypothetical protein F441_06185 [Phytophthora nicotianae CJ01A1]|uniref:Uncharacterized protein n=3 Tax=Phytophthora nicotianae TaxID=4792 RepID=W2ZP08_PHYNI|nr:hypothetical protein L915_06049 [Phytophthora nicotianae]ETL96689.1 hypothetical protein L917_05870 [Phytophthora nicotianae]ETP19971.1 hypothetical protein F441_06185 [Phytophthora nicotianae CJ01A1]ETP47949.1 hypothetical protein F442_06210 [Phytophthora nicotianae P10297]
MLAHLRCLHGREDETSGIKRGCDDRAQRLCGCGLADSMQAHTSKATKIKCTKKNVDMLVIPGGRTPTSKPEISGF